MWKFKFWDQSKAQDLKGFILIQVYHFSLIPIKDPKIVSYSVPFNSDQISYIAGLLKAIQFVSSSCQNYCKIWYTKSYYVSIIGTFKNGKNTY